MLDMAEKNGVPIFKTEMTTSEFIANSVRWLSEELAPRISIHGVSVLLERLPVWCGERDV